MRAPEGLSIRKIVRHVYNSHNSLFETVELEDVKRDVTQYLASQSKNSSSPIERTSERGVYRLNPTEQTNIQLMLDFKEEEKKGEEETTPTSIDTSLDMFEGMY